MIDQQEKQQNSSAPLIRASNPLGWHDVEIETRVEPLHVDRWSEPTSPDITLLLLTQGTAQLTECDRDSCKGFMLQRHDLMLKPAGSLIPDLQWYTQSSSPVHTLRLNVNYALYARTIEEVLDRDPSNLTLATIPVFQDPLLLHIGLTLAQELQSPSSIGPLYAQTAAHMLIVHLLRTYAVSRVEIKDYEQGLTPRQVQHIHDYIQANLTDALSLDELAQEVGFSPYYFARLFRQATQESPHQFVLRQRVDYAKRLLTNLALTLSDIAMQSGFADQSHFTQIFKRYTGVTPKSYRKML